MFLYQTPKVVVGTGVIAGIDNVCSVESHPVESHAT